MHDWILKLPPVYQPLPPLPLQRPLLQRLFQIANAKTVSRLVMVLARLALL